MRSQIEISLLGQVPISLEGLGRILNEHGFSIVDTGSDLSSLKLRGEAEEGVCHVLLIDGMVDTMGPDFVTMAAKAFPSSRIAVLSDRFDLEVMIECFRAGCHAFMIKDISSLALVASLRLVAMGEKVMPSGLVEALPDSAHPSAHGNGINHSFTAVGLSTREVEILACLVAGYSNKIISRQLGISEATVKVHVKAILRKVGVQNRTQAAIWAMGENVPSADKESCDAECTGHCHNGDS
ncbi:response regulator transcription factor [Sphingomonas oryzagri]|jgi:two-component system nitrate/nitrite response regulator NarL|uniref:Response regulator transcription factor n=1 Tax=Sphingomonas oryzagri TaxID=3042314 RepID=A0ABT6N1P5_9SPHN|nr:response regulator transcription factor [Sphingomonas oryzagri]MDH7639195.1 response regulator transcription factor [Sphingomonas oryzagri]